MKDKYYVIFTSDDGETSIFVESQNSLLEKIKEGYWGPISFPDDGDFTIGESYRCQQGDVGDTLFILKGPLVTPKAVQKVTEWEL